MAKLVLDYDGTLHECSVIYAPAMQKAYDYAANLGAAKARVLADEETRRWIGFAAGPAWDTLIPAAEQEVKDACGALVAEELVQLVQVGKARLYPYALEALDELKQAGHTLIFLSNCKRSYMNAHIARFGLDRFFEGFYCAEEYDNEPKWRIFDFIRAKFPDEDRTGYVVIGDRHKDLEVAVKHNLPAIGCNFGYGSAEELVDATAICESLQDLPDLISRL